jgi:hypothetical protein
MNHHTPDDRPDPRSTFPASPPIDPPRPNWNDDFRLEIFPGADGDWYHRIVSVHNGNVVLDEGYRNKGDLVDLLQRAFPAVHEVAGPPKPAPPPNDEQPGDIEPPFDLQPFEEES